MELLNSGELAALATALMWTLAAVAWTAAGKHVGALSIAFIRLVLACGFLSAHGAAFRGHWLPTDADAKTWLVLGFSGFVGFFIADLCLFKAFVMIGPRITLLIQALVPPITAVISWMFLDDRLTALDCLGMVVTLAGIVWVVLERSEPSHRARTREHFRQGLWLAVLAAVGQAIAFVLSKKGIGDYDVVAGTYIRVLAGILGFAMLISAARRWPRVTAAVHHTRAMTIAVFGAFVGPFLGVALSLVAVRECTAGVATTLISTTPVMILPMAILVFREKVSPRAAGGALLSIVGVALLVIPFASP